MAPPGVWRGCPHPSTQQVSFFHPARCCGVAEWSAARRREPVGRGWPIWVRRAQPPSPLRGKGWLSPAATAEAPCALAACLLSSPPFLSRLALLPPRPLPPSRGSHSLALSPAASTPGSRSLLAARAPLPASPPPAASLPWSLPARLGRRPGSPVSVLAAAQPCSGSDPGPML